MRDVTSPKPRPVCVLCSAPLTGQGFVCGPCAAEEVKAIIGGTSPATR